MMTALKNISEGGAEALNKHIKETVDEELRKNMHAQKIDVFKYVDPVDHSVADNQGIRLFFSNGRVVWRLSGEKEKKLIYFNLFILIYLF